jgi:hypothetical protein
VKRTLAAAALFSAIVVPAVSAAKEPYPGFHTPRRAIYCQYATFRPLGLTCWRPRDGYTVAMHVTGRPITGYQYANRRAYEDASPILGYGRSWGSYRVIGCKSTAGGLTCKNRGGHGWTIGKLSSKVF